VIAKTMARIRAIVLRRRLGKKLYWVVTQLRCEHTHTWRARPSVEWLSSGVIQPTPHYGIRIEGCYLCGKVWTNDCMGPNGPRRSSI
jgi:hypothetical protein